MDLSKQTNCLTACGNWTSQERDLRLTNAFDVYKKLTEQASDYKESFREAQVKFEAGVMNAVEFMLVQNYLDQASLSVISAKYNYLVQTKVLD